MELSVVIPTYNRRERLLACLETLVAQSVGRERFEVVVVSDGSTDGTPVVAAEAGRRLGLELRAIETGHGGAAHARNQGASVARGRVLAFIDDDIEVGPGWLEAGLAHFAAPEVGGVEGATEGVLGPDSLYRLNVSNLAGGQYPTCNIFYRREAFARAGGFDVRFRRAREDSDLAFRILDLGYRIPFEPRARARHVSHHRSVRVPWFIASTLPDSVLLWAKHPGRDRLRPRFYLSDAAQIGLCLAALVLAFAGRLDGAGLVLLPWAGLVARRMWRELVPGRALAAWRWLAFPAVYAALPFLNLWYLAVGTWRVRRGLDPTRPI